MMSTGSNVWLVCQPCRVDGEGLMRNGRYGWIFSMYFVRTPLHILVEINLANRQIWQCYTIHL